MIKICKIFFWCLIGLLLLWQLPECFNFFLLKPTNTPFTLYSSVVNDFAILNYNDDKNMQYMDHSGREYSEDQFDSILPAFYYRQLITDGRFPDTICGKAVTHREIQLSNFNMRISPLDINKTDVGVQQLLESMSGRVELELPDDIFRITNTGIEFIKMESNTIDSEKSDAFTEVMLQKGFVFPASRMSGNPTDRKEYDEGYVILDNELKLFHLKQTVGRPYVKNIPLPKDLNPKHLFITEFPSRKWLCFISDDKHEFWVVDRDSYSVRKVGIPSFNPEEESMLIIGNMFDWTIRINRPHEEAYYAIDADDYSLIDSLSYPTSNKSIFGLKFTSSKDKFVKPRLIY